MERKIELPIVEKMPVDIKTIKDYLFTSQTKLNERQQQLFIQLAIRNQLDPFKREIYAIPYGNGNDFNIVTGYQTYIQRAETTGNLDGWECISLKDDKGKLSGAKVTIWRKDFAHPFVWETVLAEFDKGHGSWKVMPEFMIKKVCIGQGFRLAFPNELGGLPYLQEELEGLQPQNESLPMPKPVDAGVKTIQTGIDQVMMKQGESKGKAGTQYITQYIIEVGKQKYKTFDKKIAEEAKKAKEAGMQTLVEYKTGEYGNEIVSLNIIWPKEREPGED